MLYTSAKAYVQFKAKNILTVHSKNGAVMSEIVLYAYNSTQFTNLKNVLTAQGVPFTEDDQVLSLTIAWNSAEDFVLNNSTSTAYIAAVEVVYVPVQA